MGPLNMNTCNKREISSKKRKLKDSKDSHGNLSTLLSNKSGLQNSKVSVKEESNNSGFHRETKPRVSHIDGKEFSNSKDNNTSKIKSTANRILLTENRENPMDRSIEKERQVMKYRAKLPTDHGCYRITTEGFGI
ncbi:Uncharacterized protein Adt_43144 [Abeliophyllum distichum]|uniref:Uncharacterized protein n=1 Tax=Abeliophyllum distichum TaxID=126358 RepID=A0ABD1PTN8_9LAMI